MLLTAELLDVPSAPHHTALATFVSLHTRVGFQFMGIANLQHSALTSVAVASITASSRASFKGHPHNFPCKMHFGQCIPCCQLHAVLLLVKPCTA